MKYPVIENLLPRSGSNQEKSLNNLSNLLDNAIDFGTNLLKWGIDKNSTSDANIVPILFLRNTLSIADGISILIKKSSIDNSKTLVRALMESVISLEYLLQENTKNRALSYFVWNAHKDLRFLEQMDPMTESGKQMKANMAKDKFAGKTQFGNHPEFELGKKNAEELLKLPDYIPVEEEFQRTLLKKKNPNWFTLYDGPADFEQLSSKVNLNALYQFHYRAYSRNVHSTNVHHNVFFPNDDGTADIIQIRFSKDSLDVSVDTLNFLILTYMTFQRELLPEKNDDFLDWYKNEFQKHYKQLLEVSVKTNKSVIG